MGEKEADLTKKVEELQESNINLRFNTVEKELLEIKTLLKESINRMELNHELALKNIGAVKDKVAVLEEKYRNCPINTYKVELKRYASETSFLRAVFANPIKGVLALTAWIALVMILLAALGLEPLIKLIALF